MSRNNLTLHLLNSSCRYSGCLDSKCILFRRVHPTRQPKVLSRSAMNRYPAGPGIRMNKRYGKNRLSQH